MVHQSRSVSLLASWYQRRRFDPLIRVLVHHCVGAYRASSKLETSACLLVCCTKCMQIFLSWISFFKQLSQKSLRLWRTNLWKERAVLSRLCWAFLWGRITCVEVFQGGLFYGSFKQETTCRKLSSRKRRTLKCLGLNPQWSRRRNIPPFYII